MKRSTQAGLTLIEVMVAMLLLSITLLGLAAAFPGAHLAVFQGRASTRAAALAEQRLEVARNTPYGELAGLAGTDDATYSPYTVETAVAVNAPSSGLTTVTVTVTGPEIVGPTTPAMGPTRVVLETFISAP